MIEADLVAHLKGNVTLNTLIGGRIYPLVAPQNVTIPFTTYQVVNGRSYQCMGGDIYQENNRFQIDVYSKTYSEVKTIANTIKSILVGFMASNNINIMDDRDPETLLYRQIIDFKLKD